MKGIMIMKNSYTIQTIEQINNLCQITEPAKDELFLSDNKELKLAESIYRDFGADSSKKIGKLLLAMSE